MGLFLGIAVLAFFITAGADVPTDLRPNVIYYTNGNTTQGSVFQQNVVSSLDLLVKQTPLKNGSADYKIGNGSGIVWSHGECYYNLSAESCSTCLGSIRDIFKQEAPLSVGAAMWKNTTDQSCYLRYENHNFTQASPPPPAPPGVDVGPNIAYYNGRNTEQGSIFLKNLETVLDYLFGNTPPNGSANYSYGDYPDRVWGHAQCYNMLKGCSNCLQDARDELHQAAPLSVGGTIWLNKDSDQCYLRYENYPIFADVPAVAPVPHAFPSGSLSSKSGSKKKIVVGVTVGGAALLASIGGIFLYLLRRSRQELNERHRFLLDAELERSYEGPSVFTLEELKAATKNFSEENKLGQGGFGAVYKAMLKDGTQVAVKRLSGESQQGRHEFVNEIHIITNIQHRNLVRLKGYCVQGDQKLLVYEFLENGSLDFALFSEDTSLNLDWPARFNIAIGVARGLAYLHEESQIVIIHRDIKASNILLDRNLNPKISDFGISKLFDLEKGYTSTMIAGTLGYLAPEYALRGRLTAKVDVYSFGVLLLEIISGRKCNNPALLSDEQLLLQWTWSLKKSGRLLEVVDKRLRTSEELELEFLRVIEVALVCTQEDEELRPVMSNVVTMLLGHVEAPPTQSPAPDYLAQIVSLQTLDSPSSLQESITKLEAR